MQDGRELSAAVIVATDGLHSVARAALHGDEAPRYAGCSCWRAATAFEPADLPAGRALEAWGPGARLCAFAIGRGRLSWF